MMRGLVQIASAARLAGLLPLLLVGALAADETPAPLMFRRIYVPADSLNAEIRGLLPMKRSEFERRIDLLQAAGRPFAGKPPARIEEAAFHARLSGHRLVDGTADLNIVKEGEQPAFLKLEPCNLVLESAAWKEPAARAAVLGVDAAGQLGCVIEKSGTLQLKWRLEAVASGGSRSEFDLRLPNAVRRRLEVAAPGSVHVEVDAGLLRSSKNGASNKNVSLWSYDLSGQSHIRLTADSANSTSEIVPPFIARETTTYNVIRGSLDVESIFSLDILGQPLQTLQFEADAQLDVTAVHLGEESLHYSVIASSDEGRAFITAALPSDVSGVNQVVKIAAAGNLSERGRVSLPRIRLRGAQLQEARASVAAPAWMRLQPRPVGGGAQISAAAAASSRGLDRFEFQLLGDEAAIEIAASDSAAPIFETSGTQITVEGNQVSGVLTADLTSLEGSRFGLDAHVPRQWIVDSVETEPADALADRSFASRAGPEQILQLKLNRPLNSQRSLRVVVRGHYRRPAPGEALGEAFFRLATFPDATDPRRFVSVRVNDPTAELHLAGDDGLERLDADRLPSAEQRLFESPPGSLLFVAGPASKTLHATLQPASPRYWADTLVVAEPSAHAIKQSIKIHCQPEVSSVSSVLIRLSPPPRDEVTWRLVGSDSRELPSAMEPPAQGAAADETLYRLILPRPQGAPFNVQGEWSGARDGPGEITLAWLPESSRQVGVVEIHSSHNGLRIQPGDVLTLPHSTASDAATASLQGRYRYDGGRRARIGYEVVPGGGVPPRALVEMLQLDSHHSPGGGLHEATFTICNAGLSGFQVHLPASARDCRLVNNEGEEQAIANSIANGEMTLPLDPLQQRCLVKIRYSSDSQSAAYWPIGRLVTPIPQTNLPILGRAWCVSLPPSLALLAPAENEPANSSMRPIRETSADAESDSFGFPSIFRALAGPAIAVRLGLLAAPEGELSKNSAFAGWRLTRIELPAESQAQITVYRPTSIAAWSICAALVALGLVVRFDKPGRWLAASAGAFAAITVGAPPPLAWLSAGVCLGLLTGTFFRLIRQEKTTLRRLSNEAPSGSTRGLSGAASAGFTVLLVLIAAADVVAVPPPSGQSGSRRRVIFPVDEAMQPAGDYVYVDTDFYADLQRATLLEAASIPAWLIESARVEVPSQLPLHGATAAVDEIQAALEIHTFQPSASVRLPLRRDQVTLLKGAARLDGQPAALTWQMDGSALTVNVPSPGKHRLTLSMAAALARTDSHVSLDVDFPLAAVFALDPPAGVGRSFASSAESNIAHLSLQWLLPQSRGSGAMALQGEQLEGWQIQPGSVVLQGQYRLNSSGHSVREAVIQVDPRLRLLPGLASPNIRRTWVEEGSSNAIRIEFNEPATDVQFRLAWLWPDVSGLGELLLPRTELRADRLNRDWTGVFPSEGLAIEVPSAENPVVSATEFAQVWAGAKTPAVVLADHRMNRQRPAVHVEFDELPPEVEQTVDWSLSSVSARAILAATLRGIAPTRFVEHIALPAQLKVKRVSAMQAGRAMAIRWRQSVDGLLTMSRLESPGRDEVWTITAEFGLPLADNRPNVTLPPMNFANVRHAKSAARIYRQHDVQLRLIGADGWFKADGADDSGARRELGQLVAALTNEGNPGSKPIVVSRVANRPQLTGTMLIRTDEADGDWRCEANFDMRITGGVLDVVRLSIPDDWSGPFEVDPPMSYRLDVGPTSGRRQLTLRPKLPFSDRVQLGIRGQLSSSGSGIRAPDVELVDASNVQRFVLLDRGSLGRRIDWDTTGLSAVAPEAIAVLPAHWRGAAGELFRAGGSRFDATAHMRQSTSSAPRVHLADIHATIYPARRAAIVAHLTIRPATARQAVFTLPPGYRLVQVLIDDVPATCEQSGLRTWQLPTPAVVPYRLTIVCDTSLPAGGIPAGSARLQSPEMIGMEIQKTLWSIGTVDERRQPQISIAAPLALASSFKRCSAADAGLARLEAAAMALDEVASSSGGNIPAAIVTEVFHRWEREFNTAKTGLDEVSAHSAPSDDFQMRSQRLVESAAKSRQRLQPAAEALTEQPRSQWPESAANVYALGPVPVSELAASFSPTNQIGPWRMLAAWGLALSTLAFLPMMTWRYSRDWLLENGRFLVAACGVAWWLLAPLGWLGWLLVVAAMWLTARRATPSYPAEAGSTLRRLAPSNSR